VSPSFGVASAGLKLSEPDAVGVAVGVSVGCGVRVAPGTVAVEVGVDPAAVALTDGVGVSVGVLVLVPVLIAPIRSTPFVTTRFEIGAASWAAFGLLTTDWLKVNVAAPFAIVCRTIVASTPDPVGPAPDGAPRRTVAFAETVPAVLSTVQPGRSKVDPPLVEVQLLKKVPSLTEVIDISVGSKLRPNCVPTTGTSLETITVRVTSCPIPTVPVGLAIDSVPSPGTVLGVGLAITTVVVGRDVLVGAAVNVAITVGVAVIETVGVSVAVFGEFSVGVGVAVNVGPPVVTWPFWTVRGFMSTTVPA
jgi:hypothetical protein